MKILYLPYGGFSDAGDRVQAALTEPFVLQRVESFDDAVSLLALQHRNRIYEFLAFVVGKDMVDALGEIGRARLACPWVPLICLTHRKPLSEIKARLLHLGADDCLPVRHFSKEELRATIARRIYAYQERELYRSSEPPPKPSTLTIHSVHFDLLRFTATCENQVVEFTMLEAALVEELVLAYPRIVSHERLEKRREPFSESEDRNLIAVIFSRVRGKFKQIDAPLQIEPKRNFGYQLIEKPT